MTFSQLKIGDHFEFSEKTGVGGGMYNLVGIKKTKNSYRMGGLLRIPELDVKVIKVKKPLN